MLIKGTKERSDVNQGNEGDGLKIFLRARRDGETLLRHSELCRGYRKATAGCNELIYLNPMFHFHTPLKVSLHFLGVLMEHWAINIK